MLQNLQITTCFVHNVLLICIEAIVGGGIGGTSAAYFMRQLFGSTVHIDVYESSEKLCGRVSTVKVNNRMYESGASIIHGKNMYAHAAAKMFGKIFLVVTV